MRFLYPTANDTDRSHEALSHLFVRVASIPRAPITFDFSECLDLRPMGLVLLAGMVRQLQLRGIQPTVDIATMSKHVYSRFADSGCRQHLFAGAKSSRNALFRHDEVEDEDAIIEYLKNQWLAGARLSMSPLLRDALVSRIWEIYANAFEHGDSAFGVYTCGELRGEDTLILTVADFGPGIPSNAALKLRKPWVTGDIAMEWAFTEGTTTSTNQRYPRGLGLDLLKQFVQINRGRLDIYSHHGHGRVDGGEPVCRSLLLWMGATIVQIRLNCDDRTYVFERELEQQLPPPGTPLF